MKKILIAFGTRPEAIKMAPLIREFKQHTDKYEVKICVTGQHRHLLDQMLEFFDIEPDFDLELMKEQQDLSELSAAVLLGMKTVLQTFPADYLFVHGDTTTSTFAALAGFYAGVQICHVEAGLRTHQLQFPFPEEANRQLTARITAMHFTPTPTATENLLREGINAEQIFLTGNTIIDALHFASEKLETASYPQVEALKKLIQPKLPMVLVTCHRRENFGLPLQAICEALTQLATQHEVQFIFPVHLNPNISEYINERIGKVKNISLVAPLDYPTFIWLMKNSSFILTDSGGVQEEGTALGKQILLMRAHTERPEVVASGQVTLVSADRDLIVQEATRLLEAKIPYTVQPSPYGNGDSAKQILAIMNALPC